jgi:hypothetical protein
MKTSRVYSPMLLLVASMLLFACERTDPFAETDESGLALQGAQGIGPVEGGGNGGPSGNGGGPCSLDPLSSIFTVSTRYGPTVANFDFAVILERTSDCPEFANKPNCTIRHGQYTLTFPDQPGINSYGVNVYDFESIVARDLHNPSVKQVWEGVSESSLVVEDESIIYFRWLPEKRQIVPPAIESLAAGGLCIVGIITDPCPWCPPNNRPLKPLVPRHLGH